MSVNIVNPATWVPGWSSDGTTASFPVASVPEMSDAESRADTGSISDILYALLCKIYSVYAGLTGAYKPVNMAIYKRSTVDEATGVVTVDFSVRFTTAVAVQSQNVVAETPVSEE